MNYARAADVGEVMIENESLEVIIALKGAELQSIRHKKTNTEYLWQGDPDYWERRAITMFPVNVAFKDGKYTHKGQESEMPFLGLVESGPFSELPSDRSDEVALEYVLSEEAMKRYPFAFRFRVRFQLVELSLIQEFTIDNLGKETMYYALGGHPGFRAPLDGVRKRGDYQIHYSKKLTTDRVEINQNLHQTTRVPYLRAEDRLALDDPRVPNSGMFLEKTEARRIGVSRKGAEPYVMVDLGDFPNVNIWTPEGMPFVCIEPMLGHHDRIDSSYELSQKECVVALGSGKQARYRFSIIVNPAVPGP